MCAWFLTNSDWRFRETLFRIKTTTVMISFLFVWFLNVLVSKYAISRTGPKTDVWQFYVLPHTRQSGKTMTPVSAGHQ